jgi:carboxyl-terminal processing protease
MTLDQTSMTPLIENVVQLMEAKCIRLNGQGVSWRSLFSDAKEHLVRSNSLAEFETRVNRVLMQGGLSHAAFFHDSAQRVPARYAINATFCALDTLDGPRWVFQDVHHGGPAYHAGVYPGDILLRVEGREIRPPTPPTFALGQDAPIVLENLDGQCRETTIVLPKPDPKGKAGGKPPMAEPTSVVAEAFPQDVGYLRIAFFPGAGGGRFARDLTKAIEDLAGCNRLLVDLRGNLGGFIGSLRLMSYLTPGRVPVGYSLTRVGEDRGLRREQLACLDRLPSGKVSGALMFIRFRLLHRDRSIRLMTEGLGPKPFHGRVAMLINEHTCSAGEMVAAFAAENKLATLVGARTSGQVLGGANFRVGEGFVLRIPAAGWYTWQGTIVEGKGVRPDVEVPFSISELRYGRDTQLASALDVLAGM